MNQLHPNLVKSFLEKIPGATSIIGVEQGGPETFILVVDIAGSEERLEVPRVRLADHLRTGYLTLHVREGITCTELMEMISKKYGLYWVEGIDYVKNDTPALELDSGLVNIEIPESSFMWRGMVTATLHKVEPRDNTPAKIPLQGIRTVLLLSQKIFKGEGSFLTNKGNLTQKAAEAICDYLNSFGDNTYTLKELSGCKVIKVLADKFSSVAILDVKNKGNVFIRFDYEKDNAPKPD